MKKKNKGLVISVIFLSLVIVGLGGFIVYDKFLTNKTIKSTDNNKNKKEQKKDTIEKSSNIISVATNFEDKKIYGFKKDGSKIEIMDINEYTDAVYTYSDGKLYLYLYSYSPGKVNVDTGETIEEFTQRSILGYIEINDNNHTFNKLTDIDADTLPGSIAIANNIIYYTYGNDKIFQYNIGTKEISASNNFGLSGTIYLYTISKDYLGYQVVPDYENGGPSMGIIDIKNEKADEIAPYTYLQYILNNKVIYLKYDTPNTYSSWTYYEYNINDKSSKQISESTKHNQSLYDSYIIPINDYYIYVDENIIYKYINGKREKLYEIDNKYTGYGTQTVNLISENTLHISYGSEYEAIYKYGNLNLDTLTFENTNDGSYSKILYIK